MLRELHKQRASVTSPLKSQQGAVSKKGGAVSGRKGSAAWGSSDLIVAPRPSWVPDKNATDCYLCAASFSIMNRRCTRFRKGLPEMGYSASNQLRVCFTCYALPVTDSIAAAAKRKRDAGDSGQSLYTSTARQRPSQREATSGGSSRVPRRNPTPPPAMPTRSASAPTSPASSPHPSPPTASTEQRHHHQQHQEHTTPERPGKEERGKHVMNAVGSGTGAYNPLILDGTALRRESRGDRYELEIQPTENEREEGREEKEASGTTTTELTNEATTAEGEAMGKTSEATLLPSLQDSSPLYVDSPPSGIVPVAVHSRLTASSPAVTVPPLLLASLPTKAP